jgi:hypothetical protein
MKRLFHLLASSAATATLVALAVGLGWPQSASACSAGGCSEGQTQVSCEVVGGGTITRQCSGGACQTMETCSICYQHNQSQQVIGCGCECAFCVDCW